MFKRLLFYTASFLILFALAGVAVYQAFNDNLPDIDAWSFQPKRVTKVFSSDGRHLKDFLEENREILTYEEIPKSLQNALISIEDQRFFTHWGIDIRRIFGSLLAGKGTLRFGGKRRETLRKPPEGDLFRARARKEKQVAG